LGLFAYFTVYKLLFYYIVRDRATFLVTFRDVVY